MKNNQWKIIVILCLSLGLAPWWFSGEPHIIGKIKWVIGGAEGMAKMDYFDFILHGTPWVLLVAKTIQTLTLRKIKEGHKTDKKETNKRTI